MLKRIVLSTVTLAVVTLIGCGGPPKDLIDKATLAQKKATEAKADVYAKEDFDAATAAMTKGSDAVKKSDWDGAKKAYTEAAAKFEAAAKAAPDNMKKATEDATKMVADMKAMMDANAKDKAMMAAMKAMKKDDKAKFDAMNKEVAAMVTEAEGMIADNAMGALEKLSAAKAKMDEMKAMTAPKKK